MTRRRTKVPKLVCKLIVVDEEGILVETAFLQGSESDVQVETQLHLGAEPLALAGVAATATHSLLKTAEAPEELQETMMQVLAQVHSLINVRAAAKNQKRRDRRDQGVSDDWPKPQDDSEIPF